MSTIIPFLAHEAFGPADIHAMSLALEHACIALRVNGDAHARETMAIRIIDLARRGERDWVKLRDHVLEERNVGSPAVNEQHEKQIGRVAAN